MIVKEGQADAESIEVTEEMIEAGLAVLVARCPDTATGDHLDREMVADIFVAMECQARAGEAPSYEFAPPRRAAQCREP
jgi:hypothetical protein